MADQSTKTKTAKCQTCGKRIAPESREGSLTTYLFGAFNCTCGQDQAGAGAQAAGLRQAEPGDLGFCPKCGLRKVSSENPGSITGFLFQSTRCKCPPEIEFADGRMSERFLKLKQGDGGAVFSKSPGSNGQTAEKTPGQSAVPAIDLAPGAVIGGVYEIDRLLGKGGMGEVYLARHESLGRQCALKVIPPDQVTEEGWLRFKQEATAVAKLDHINLVRVTDLGIYEGCLPFYAMDFVEGKTLADQLAESGQMPLPLVLEIFAQVCDGVDCAHRNGILHRDLKPANIMIAATRDGKAQAKILDFGLAKLTGHDRSKQSLTAVGYVFGSPFYMSPEQCNGEKVDRRSDLYSLGCTIFECLAGRPPFSGQPAALMCSHMQDQPPSLESIMGKGNVPPALEVVMAKLLRKNPVERYQTMTELKEDLERVSRGESVQPFYVSRGKNAAGQNQPGSPPGPRDHRPPGQTFPRALVMAAVLIFSISLFAILSIVRPRQVAPTVVTKQVVLDAPRGDAIDDLDEALENGPEIKQTSTHTLENAFGQGQQWDGKPFYLGQEERQDKTYKHWRFPEWCGKYATIIEAGPQGGKKIPASGDILLPLPETESLGLRLTNDPPYTEALFKGLTDDNFSSLEFRIPEFVQNVDAAIPSLQTHLSVKALTVAGSARYSSTDLIVQIANCFPHLTSLTAKYFCEGESLIRIHRLKELENLKLQSNSPGLQNAGPCLDGLTCLTTLKLLDCPISKPLLDHISSCPNLRVLSLNNHDLPDQSGGLAKPGDCLDGLPKLHHLEELILSRLEYCHQFAAVLGKCQSLKKLTITTTRRLDSEQIEALRRDLPHTELKLVSPKASGGNHIDRFKPGVD